MKVLVSGASGLIGSALGRKLADEGHEVIRMVRRLPQPGEKEISWNPGTGSLLAVDLEGMDAVVHLAGENIAAGRWTEARKQRLRDSRIRGTRLLCENLRQLREPPQVLVCASAIGYYGDRGERELDEGAEPGEGFLAGLVQEWEGATAPAAESGIRVVLARFGVVLSSAGGALAKQLLPFRLGLGGRVGDGRQYVSWIGLDDAVGTICHALGCESLDGPVNVVAPNPVTNAEYTRALGRVLRRPTPFVLPAWGARLALGEMADELLLASARVRPGRLTDTGYAFQYPELEGALRCALNKE